MANILDQHFSNVQDIDNFFNEKKGQGFIDYFNSVHAQQNTFANYGGKPAVPLISSKNSGNWNKVWNSIPILFGKESINLAEFLSINIAMAMETGSAYSPRTELVGNSKNPGLSYAFNAVSGIKKSYNLKGNDLSNKTAYSLFNDTDYKSAHGNKPFGNILKDTTNTAWETDKFPLQTDDKATSRKSSLSGFIFEADFMKFRGRGFIQTTGRVNYLKIIEFIMNYDGNNSTILKYKKKWNGKTNQTIATISTNNDWDDLFQNTELIIANAAVNIHAKSSGKRNAGPKQSQYNHIDVSVGEDRVLRDEGPVYWAGRRINGAVKYAKALLARVKQIVDDLNLDSDDDIDNGGEDVANNQNSQTPANVEQIPTEEEQNGESGGSDSNEDDGSEFSIETIEN
jgi:hypothetical protein